MKKTLVLAMVCILAGTCAWGWNLHKRFTNDPEVTVYLKEVVNKSGNPAVDILAFRKEFVSELDERLNMSFKHVESEKDADVSVSAVIKVYDFQEKVMPRFYSAYAVIADTTAPKSYGKLVVDYEILDPVKGEKILAFKDFTTDERRPIADMKGANGFLHTARANIDRFIYRAFYKQKDK